MTDRYVRVRCTDYGDEWVVEADIFMGEERDPRTSGPYRFASAQDAQQFIERLRAATSVR